MPAIADLNLSTFKPNWKAFKIPLEHVTVPQNQCVLRLTVLSIMPDFGQAWCHRFETSKFSSSLLRSLNMRDSLEIPFRSLH
jgi:hypothetical protein